eukprot:RCo021517
METGEMRNPAAELLQAYNGLCHATEGLGIKPVAERYPAVAANVVLLLRLYEAYAEAAAKIAEQLRVTWPQVSHAELFAEHEALLGRFMTLPQTCFEFETHRSMDQLLDSFREFAECVVLMS